MAAWIGLLLLVGLATFAIITYNNLVSMRNRCFNCFSQIDVQLKRRYDLIPQLVEIARGYMAHERQSLEAVIAARNQAMAISGKIAGARVDSESITKLMGAEAAVASSMSRLLALSESYPDLKANRNMMQLTEELTSSENRISYARQAYNDAVMDYNTGCESFPANILASTLSFKRQAMWQIDQVEERELRPVKF